MVIQDESDAPIEVSIMNTPNQYVIVKNHVRELAINEPTSSGHTSAQDNCPESGIVAKKMKKSPKKNKKVMLKDTHQIITENLREFINTQMQDVTKQLKEIQECCRNIQAQQQQILNIIQSRFGTQKNNLKPSNLEEECHCKPNTKIIFNEDGQQVVTEPSLDNHVCPKKMKRKYSDVAKNIDIHSLIMKQPDSRNLSIEHEEQNISLPNDLKSLAKILHDTDIAISYRNKVIDKVKSIKQEHSNDIRFNKLSMIEKLKSNSNSSEIFEFKGANLFSLSGYPDWK